jgi:hypothetical protein
MTTPIIITTATTGGNDGRLPVRRRVLPVFADTPAKGIALASTPGSAGRYPQSGAGWKGAGTASTTKSPATT